MQQPTTSFTNSGKAAHQEALKRNSCPAVNSCSNAYPIESSGYQRHSARVRLRDRVVSASIGGGMVAPAAEPASDRLSHSLATRAIWRVKLQRNRVRIWRLGRVREESQSIPECRSGPCCGADRARTDQREARESSRHSCGKRPRHKARARPACVRYV